MARTNNLTNFLNDVSSAIKQKTGDNTPIPASEFDTEILSIETGGNYQQKTVNIINNGTQIFTPEAGYDAIDQLTVITNVPMQSLQSKSVQITSNGNISVLPDTGYQGMTQVDLTVNVPSGSGDIKLFETIEEMQADPTAQEGDLAVVYRNDMVSPSPGDTINSFSPPATVVFDTAITSSVSLVLRSGMIFLPCTLTATSFAMRDMYGRVMTQAVTYTSNDGLTYTRTDSGAETYDLGEDITIPSDANTNILKFFQSRETIFEGLYEYNSTNNEYEITTAQLDATSDYVYEKTFYGKNGAEEGTLQQTTNLTNEQIKQRAEIYNKISNLSPIETDMTSCFANCTSFTIIPQLNTSNVTKMTSMFSNCKSLETIPLLDTSKITDMFNMFWGCSSLTSIPLLDTSNVTSMEYVFTNCTSLETVPLLDTSNVTDMLNMFSGCTSLTTIPLLNTSSVTNIAGMFNGCTNLTTILQLNTGNVTNMTNTFSGCTSLSNTSLNNILAMCINATSYIGTKTLATIGLTSIQATTCQGLSNYQDFIDAGWTTGY